MEILQNRHTESEELQEHKDAGCEQGPFANLKTQHKVKNTEIM
jgi:hypothetical protein